MTSAEIEKACDLAKQQRVTLTLYTGTNDFALKTKFQNREEFDTKFAEKYCVQKQGSKGATGKFNAYYGPGIYLTNNPLEAKGYGTYCLKFDLAGTPFLDATGDAFTKWRKRLGIGGGPQAVLQEKNLPVVLLVAAGQETSYYLLRTGAGVKVTPV